MPVGWKNPKLQYNFTLGEYEDKKKNYPDLTWKEYREMSKNEELDLSNVEDINIPIMSDEDVVNKTNIDPDHYHLEIQPFDYIHDNQMGFAEGNVIKYISRWRHKKDGLNDLYKAKQYIDMLIAKELIKDGESRT